MIELKVNRIEEIGSFLEICRDAMILVDKSGAIILSNQQTEVLFGCTPNELKGKRIEVLIPERFREKHPGHRGDFFSKPRNREMGSKLELSGSEKTAPSFRWKSA
jgi:PAS domain S-box-containing protein